MTIWTMVQAVKALHAFGYVDREIVEQASPALYLRPFGDELVRMAQALGVEVDVEDLRVEMEPEVATLRMEVDVWWQPSTTKVELLGGPYDGKIMEVSDPWDGVNMPRPRDAVIRSWRTESTVPTSTVQHLRYEMAGWHEQGRRWVLEQR